MISQIDRSEETAMRRSGDVTAVGNFGLALAVTAVVCGLAGGRSVDSTLVDGYGLIRALPVLYWIGVVLGVGATFILFRVAAANDGSRYATAVPVLWLLLLHTAPHLAHSHARYPAVWSHLGLVRFIDEFQTGDALLEARFAWPGFYGSFTAPLAQLDGWVLETILRTWPTWITGGTAVLVGALGRRSYPTVPLIGSLSAFVYILLAWTGHDYFSPQSVGFVWFITILVILESGPLETGSAWSAAVPVLPRFSVSGGDRPASRSTPAFVALMILSLGAVVSHPVVPFFVCTALVILGLYGRSLAWRLVLLVGLAYAIWFLVSAEPWWSTRVGELLDPGSGLFGEATGHAAEPVVAASPERLFVTRTRMYLGLATLVTVLAMGVSMSGDRLRHLRPAVPLVPLVAVQVLAGVLVGYRSEFANRVVLFTLPLAAILVARVLASLRVRTLPVTAALVAVALCPLLLLARFGGERFEFTTEPDRTAIEAAYARADNDTLFVADNRFISWRDQTIGHNVFTEHPVEPSTDWIETVEAKAAEAGTDRIIVVLTDSQLGWKMHGEGLPSATFDELAQWLLDRPGSELLFHDKNSWAIEL